GVDRQRTREYGFELVRNLDAERAWGRAAAAVGGGEPELREVFAPERAPRRQQLYRNQGERKHVRPRPRGAEMTAVLLGSAVVRRERHQGGARLGEQGGDLCVRRHQLGDAEVEQLDDDAFATQAAADHEQVVRFHIAVRDAVAVRELERLGDGA